MITKPACHVCEGTGIYSCERINELWLKYYKNRKGKKHMCSGSCSTCGQFWRQDDLSWMHERLQSIKEKMEFLSDAYFKFVERKILKHDN